jgi:uncharacterized repeat protein (TIGR01451 family)
MARSIASKRIVPFLLASALMAWSASALAVGFISAAPLTPARFVTEAARLPDGRVMVCARDYSPRCDIYDPTQDQWTSTVPPPLGLAGQTLTILESGRVLVAGGSDNSGTTRADAWLYDPAANAWASAHPMVGTRTSHTATLLENGKVLVAAGWRTSSTMQTTAEIYDPASDTWALAGVPQIPRAEHTATLLSTGKVLLVGGFGTSDLASAELYDPGSNTWTAAASLHIGRSRHTATLLPDGRVLVAGGDVEVGRTSSVEIYDPVSNSWGIAASLITARDVHTSTLLPSGKVLVVGGYDFPTVIGTAELYDPALDAWTSAGSMITGRLVHVAALLPSGRVLIASGRTTTGPIAASELYAPATASSVVSMSPSSAVVGQPYRVDIKVEGDSGVPTGSVEIVDDAGSHCGPVTLVNGLAGCSLASASAGERLVTSTYRPDTGAFAPSSIAVPYHVDRATTHLQLVAAPEPSTPSESIDVTVVLAVDAPGSGAPGGPVSVVADTGASCFVLPPSTNCTLSALAEGVHAITASYGGNADFLPSAATIQHTVHDRQVELTIDSVQPEPSIVGQPVAAAFSLASSGATPTGVVDVDASTGEHCSAAVATGACELVFMVDGPRTLTASYAGDAQHDAAQSNGVTHEVNDAPTSIAVTGHAPDPSLPSESVEVDVLFGVPSPGSGTPVGAILVGDGVDSCTIPQGATSCSLVLSTRGERTLTATYPGDGNYAASSAQVMHHVNRLPVVTVPAYRTAAGATLHVDAAHGLLSAASDPDGESVSITNVGKNDTAGVSGSANLLADGSFTFVPSGNTIGTATFTLHLTDGREFAEANVAIEVAPAVDLAVSLDDGTDFVAGGGLVDYTLTVRNDGVSDAFAAHVSDPLPAGLFDAQWSCVAEPGATCTPGGTGGIEDVVNIPTGGSVVYLLQASVPVLPELPLSNTATAAAGAAAIEVNAANNSATDVDAVGIFADGVDHAVTR